MSGWTEEDLRMQRLMRDRNAVDLLSPKVKPQRTNKYNVSAIAERTFQGIVYDSKREMEHAKALDCLLKGGRILKIERQVSYVLMVNGQKICKHVVDFRVTWHDGRVQIMEVKGFSTRDWRIKMKLFAALFPDVEYEVIT